eukprot:CAMPEP_0179192164 /NCGR_PEP_ID=MMETSP0796-20121207/95460_1 /TAXON_ID=73915 /ORGANISM="Pyrodinium bahamense, Strain pbaha01" /LENGTH=87 /DNA_ID=CAMNT_0020896409 /DNA_START=251 /DNA_END=511 /DNA_ORIENTATION=+
MGAPLSPSPALLSCKGKQTVGSGSAPGAGWSAAGPGSGPGAARCRFGSALEAAARPAPRFRTPPAAEEGVRATAALSASAATAPRPP